MLSPGLPQRNDPCLCGSGKKYKKCCLNKPQVQSKSSLNPYQAAIKAAEQAVFAQDFKMAAQQFRTALLQQKNSAQALAGLGQSLCRTHQRQEGIEYLLAAGKLLLKQAKLDKQIRHVLDLAYQLSHWNAPEQALRLASAALEIDPHSAGAFHTRALSLQALNRHAEAYQDAKRACELAPQESNASILLAVLEGKLGKLTDARQRLEEVLAKPSDLSAARAHQEIGVILDKLGEYDAAFSHLTASGKLNQQTPTVKSLDMTAAYREIESYRVHFDASFLQSTRHELLPDGLPVPVFLLGFYRSGTTLAEQIFAAHSQVISSDEVNILPVLINELFKLDKPAMPLPALIKSLNPAEIGQLRKLYWQTAKAVVGPQAMQKVLLDKTALNTLNIELINCLFPDAQVIFALRDPRDVLLSCFMQPFGLTALTAHFLDWTQGARFYALVMGYWLSVRDYLSVSCTELRYEDVLDNLEAQFTPIFEKIGLKWTDECHEFYLQSRQKVIKTPSFDQVTQPLYQTSVERWRHYQQYFVQLEPILTPYVNAFGYSSSI